jgi:prevent-host-death family protein
MKTMSAGEFKARCLKVMDDVRATREAVVITKRGRPVAKLVPAETRREDVLGCLAGVLEVLGDIEAPVVEAREWKVLR